MSILKIEGLTKNFFIHQVNREIKSCADISFQVEGGEFVGIIGLSGAGKSTIMKCINRTYFPMEGAIWYESRAFGTMNLAKASDRQILYLRKNEIGYVSQFLNVMPRTTAKEHVMSALLDMQKSEREAKEEAEEMLSYFKLSEDLWDLYPNTFSGGERLRLNLAYTMVKKPRLMLLDEPTASLDNKTKLLVKEMLQTLKSKDRAMVGIFHDLEFMEGVCDRVFNISEGEFQC